MYRRSIPKVMLSLRTDVYGALNRLLGSELTGSRLAPSIHQQVYEKGSSKPAQLRLRCLIYYRRENDVMFGSVLRFILFFLIFSQ